MNLEIMTVSLSPNPNQAIISYPTPTGSNKWQEATTFPVPVLLMKAIP